MRSRFHAAEADDDVQYLNSVFLLHTQYLVYTDRVLYYTANRRII